ncbi:hypothetical protein PB2503_08014 [Parvularcula bermudensis HTCC2503]|uniref:DUF3126 family protein n=1 Tax=Parvularcula bermudensis (strain ATCC BAA-594 / HTCC2503 / KCTC 12087) TaxID=314260 RepID=E0TH74_PARBH|nr:DUF3126 family protein [Parvularcula bermudensis]ADM09658.1 hypothetical protein PB2503_08014 [Parvularcula bermudensis HTCC2503]
MSPTELDKLSRFLKARFRSETVTLKAVPGQGAAGVYDESEFLGLLTRDEDEGEISFDFVMRLPAEQDKISAWEISRLQQILAEVFRTEELRVEHRPNKDDSAEVYIGEEFIGVLFLDTEEDETIVSFNMGILDIDLDDAEGSA